MVTYELLLLQHHTLILAHTSCPLPLQHLNTGLHHQLSVFSDITAADGWQAL